MASGGGVMQAERVAAWLQHCPCEWRFFRVLASAASPISGTQQLPHQAVLPETRRQLTHSAACSSGDGDARASRGRNARAAARSPDAWRARVNPATGRYGVHLRKAHPQAFERMRLLLGYYDLPQHSARVKPPPPSTATISMLQTLSHLRDIDPYYKLALLSYRSKLQNRQLEEHLARTDAFIAATLEEGGAGDFVPAQAPGVEAALAGMEEGAGRGAAPGAEAAPGEDGSAP